MEIQNTVNDSFSFENEIFSVSELTNQIKALLEKAFSSVCVKGEISNFKNHFSSGHMYFSLKDENCELKGAMFKGYNKNLKFSVEDGMKVLAYGDISVYSPRGQYQILVKKLEPAGLGALYLAFEALKRKLKEERLFDDNRKKKIPPYPFKIGVITSAAGAAVQDIKQVMGRRSPHVTIILRHTIVQGEGAAMDLVSAIKELEKHSDLDLIIIGRGGGSIEDLWAFNEEKVARAVADSTIPIISAIGHETDFTIVDFVADFRAPTPSAAAELASPSINEILSKLKQSTRRLSDELKNKIRLNAQILDGLSSRYGIQYPKVFLEREADHVVDQYEKLAKEIQIILNKKFSKHELLRAQLEGVNPSKILERGYAIPQRIPDGKFLRNIEDFTLGERFSLHLSNGAIEGKVTKIKEN